MTAAQDKYNIAVKGTPGPVRQFAASVTAAKNTYTGWADSLAKPVLAPLSGMLKLVKPALTAITPLVRVAAGAFGTLVTELSAKVSAGGLTSIVSTLLPHVRTTILDLGHAAGNVAAGIWGILKAFLPVSGQITGGVVKLTAKFKEWGKSLGSGTGFQSLMTTFREETPQAVAILQNLGVVLGNVGKAMFGLSSFSNSKMLLNMLLPLSQVMASLSKNTDLVRVALYGLLAVKIGQQFSWVTDAWKGIVKFAAATEGATAAEVIAAAATRAWALATAALPWVALAAAVVAVAVLIIKYHSQIWAFVQKVWHGILAVIMGTWNWVKANWPLLLGILTGPIGLAVAFIIKHWKTMTTGIAAMMDIAKESIRITWDKIKLLFLQGVDFIMRTMGKLPGPLGAPFRAAHASIKVSMDQIQRDVGAATKNIQADFDRLHGKTVQIRMNGQGLYTISGNIIAASQGKGGSGNAAGGLAAGGFITGGIPGRDSVLIRAMPGEVVVPTAMVKAGAVDHLRGQLPGFASGGQVSGPLTAPFVSGMYSSFQNQMAGSMVGAMRTSLKTAEAAAIAAAKAAAAAGGMPGTCPPPLVLLLPMPRSSWLPSAGPISSPPSTTWRCTRPAYNPNAQNPTSTAYGIGQFLDSTWATVGGHKTSDGYLQLQYMMKYIRQRYGSPNAAWAQYYAHPGGVGWYAKGGLVPGYAQGGLVPGYASGGTVARQGQTYLNAWRSRRGGHYALAVGPRPLNQQIPAMTAAYGRARTLAGAGGLSPGQHRFWANTAAGEGKLLATLRKELATERSWRYHLQLDTLALDREIRTAGNLPGLAGPVRGWKRQLAARKHTIGEITGMIGHPAVHKAAPKPKPPGVPGSIPHTGAYTDRTADLIAQLFAASAALTRTVTLDSGGTLAPGWNAAYNGTGRPEQLIPARGSGGGGGTIVLSQPRRHRIAGPARRLARPVPRQPQAQAETLTRYSASASSSSSRTVIPHRSASAAIHGFSVGSAEVPADERGGVLAGHRSVIPAEPLVAVRAATRIAIGTPDVIVGAVGAEGLPALAADEVAHHRVRHRSSAARPAVLMYHSWCRSRATQPASCIRHSTSERICMSPAVLLPEPSAEARVARTVPCRVVGMASGESFVAIRGPLSGSYYSTRR